MDSNIINEYTNFIKKELLKFYKIVLKNDYNKKLCEIFLDYYINIRYYNETNYPKEQDLIERLSKEMKFVIETTINKENEETIKNIYALFGYIAYFDDCYVIEDKTSILECFFEDENIKLEITEETKEEIKEFFKKFNKTKNRFLRVLDTKQFELHEKRIKKNFYKTSLLNYVRVSNLYSEIAVEKAFKSGVINEDKMFVELLLISKQILVGAIGLDFSRFYVADLVSSLFTKEKKIERIFNLLDNNLTKKHLILNITFEEYLNNKEKVNNYIKKGFPFAVTLDSRFDEDFEKLILFSYIIVSQQHSSYDIIMENRDKIMTDILIV